MITIRKELPSDIAGREALLDASFGNTRFAKAAERLREDRLPADGLSFVACDGMRVVGTNRLWNIMAGPNRPALLLGPLAVASDRREDGFMGDERAPACCHTRGHRRRLQGTQPGGPTFNG
jgi:predicted N-acetyltransferase YhbS